MSYESFGTNLLLILVPLSIGALAVCMFVLLRMIHAIEIRLNRLEAGLAPRNHQHDRRR